MSKLVLETSFLLSVAIEFSKQFGNSCSGEIFPELNYSNRKEVVSSIKHVKGVIKSGFDISNDFLKKNKFDLLIHGSDNKNSIEKKYVKTFKRTKNVSSTILRKRASRNLKKIK